jgi:hypothetical protein
MPRPITYVFMPPSPKDANIWPKVQTEQFMKACGEVQVFAFLTSALDGYE